MQNSILSFEEADIYLSPYYERIVRCLGKCFEDCNKLYDTFSTDRPAHFKNRTKGSFIADRLPVHMQEEFADDINVKLVYIGSVFGIIISEKIFIRFNKMDEKFGVSINKKTASTRKFLNQGILDGLPEDITLVWGGFNPDKPWSQILGYYLACFNGSLNWHYDIGRGNSTEQLRIDIQVKPTQPKRVRVKKTKKDDDKTGTNNK